MLMRSSSCSARWLLPAAMLTAAAAMPVVAQDTSHDSHHPNDPSSATPAKPVAVPASADATASMMGNMKVMQDQMTKIRAATDPKERAKLLDEHFKTMQDTMKLMMNSNGGCPMMGGGASGQGGMMGNGNMMQMMMDQMMQHQNMMQPPAKAK